MRNNPGRINASPYRQAALHWSRSSRLLQQLCFVLGCAAAVILLALVLLAPVMLPLAGGQQWARVLSVFAHDATLRRTALACAAGVLATACIFFRPHPIGPPVPRLPRMHRPRREYDP